MDNKLRQLLFAYYWLVPIVIFLAFIFSVLLGWYTNDNQSLWLAFITIGLGWTYFFQKQKFEEDKHFLESFEKFNKRFHELSDDLHEAAHNQSSKNDDSFTAINKYFDLCLEEYQLYKIGRIPEHIWRYWAEGMNNYLIHDPVKRYWERMERQKLDDGLTRDFLGGYDLKLQSETQKND